MNPRTICMANNVALVNSTEMDIHTIPDVADALKDFALFMVFAGTQRLSCQEAFRFFHQTPRNPPEIIAFGKGQPQQIRLFLIPGRVRMPAPEKPRFART